MLHTSSCQIIVQNSSIVLGLGPYENNKRPMSYIAHMNTHSHNEISFMKSCNKYLNNVVEQILNKYIFFKFTGCSHIRY